VAVDDRRGAGLDGEGGAALDRHLHGLLVAQIEHRLAGDDAFLLGAAGQMPHPAEREHLRAVFRRGHMADLLALAAHGGLLGTQVAVGVDLHLHAAVAEDALGHHGDHVDAFHLGGHDEGRRLVVGIGGAGADTGDEGLA
jgi:hypothetical protein